MCERLNTFNQREHSRVLNNHGGRSLRNKECVEILMDHGATFNQAKNAAYTYLRHGNFLAVQRRSAQIEYNRILEQFKGHSKTNQECIRHLESLGYSQGQAKNAVWKYRRAKGLIK